MVQRSQKPFQSNTTNPKYYYSEMRRKKKKKSKIRYYGQHHGQYQIF